MTKQEYYLKLWKRFMQSHGLDYRILEKDVRRLPSTWANSSIYCEVDINVKWKNIIRYDLVNDLYRFVCVQTKGLHLMSYRDLFYAFDNNMLYHKIGQYLAQIHPYLNMNLENDIYNFFTTTKHD